MRQKLGIGLGLLLLTLILIGLNAATYVQREKTPDNEIVPNRSTFNSGATGTQAIYTLLSETGRPVTRWQKPIDALLVEDRSAPATFVIVGRTRIPFDEYELRQLLSWVDGGGRLVLIGREMEDEIGRAIDVWRFTFKTNDLELLFGSDPADQLQMTGGMPASRPVQPTLFTAGVNAVQTSKFASHIEIVRNDGNSDPLAGHGVFGSTSDGRAPASEMTALATHPALESGGSNFQTVAESLPRAPAPAAQIQGDELEGDQGFTAPVVHLVGNARNILVDIPYGSGQIVLLSDPYVVSNAGVGLVDNAQLAINIMTAGGRAVAFDEFHQGYGANQNRFFAYFAGTPVIAIFGQVALIGFLVFLSRGQRFARAVTEPEPDRRTKLEYISAMAELQHRTKAYDLAIENIYGDFRRRVSNLFGVDVRMSDRRQLAKLIAERIKGDATEIEETLERCQNIIHGEPSDKREAIALASRLREIESELGMVRVAHRRTVG